ncbi:MAG: recombinase family protein [Rhodopila sp.]|nr:recombinase family protein [Rhodopila sp.]
MGGRPPLGYAVRDRELVIIADEAETVRHIFRRYLDLKSVHALRDDLAAAGITAKRYTSVAGNTTGGGPLDRGALYDLLQNHLYRGEISHKGQVYPGRHPAIVDAALWDRVQAMLADNRAARTVRSEATSPSLLAGLVHDEDGMALTPTHANKQGRRYRYYVSHDLVAGRQPSPDKAADSGAGRRRGSLRRLPARDLEAIVETRLVAFLRESATIDAIVGPRSTDIAERRQLVAGAAAFANAWPTLPPAEKIAALRRLLRGIVVTTATVELTVNLDAVVAIGRGRATAPDNCVPPNNGEAMVLTVPATLKRVGQEMRHLIDSPGAGLAHEPDRSLLRLLARAQHFRALVLRGDGRSVTQLAAEAGVGKSYFSRIVRLGFLAPDITEAIVVGRHPIELSAQRLAFVQNLPADWRQQRQALGLA